MATNVKFKLEVDSGNQGMVEDPSQAMAIVLNQLSLKVLVGATEGAILDDNGNVVGSWAMTVEP